MDATRPYRLPYRRVLLIYLVAIVGPTVGLLYLGLRSIQRQREAISSLTLSNLRLSAERLAGDLEHRTGVLAEVCLNDSKLRQVGALLEGERTPKEARRLRAVLEGVRQRHPIARHFFVIRGNTIHFPMPDTSPRRGLKTYLIDEGPEIGERYRSLFTEAENKELRQGRLDLALIGYRSCLELPVSQPSKALALARVARCLRKEEKFAESDQAYRRLVEQYGDFYDPYHRPYALAAGLELGSAMQSRGRPHLQLLTRLVRDLLEGRWELSLDQFDYYRAHLEERLGGDAPSVNNTDFQSHLELARAIKGDFRHDGPLYAGELYADGFAHGQTNYQTYYILLPSAGGQNALLGLAVDLDWVEKDLLATALVELDMEGEASIHFADRKEAATPSDALEASVTFPSVFPFWELTLTSGESLEGAGGRDRLVFAGSTVVVLGVLVLGVFVLMRDVSRQRHLNRLRSDFVSSVSHELKTPLTLIRLYGETLLDGGDVSEEERRRYYGIITRESERLTHLIERVLDFSRLERGQEAYHLEEGDIAPAVAATVAVYGQYLKRRGLNVETQLDADLPSLRFDADAVSGAVLNLMDNAAKYCGDSKFIAVRLGCERDEVILEVEDHGPGIPAAEREKIFQQFYRGPGQRGKGGSGLGLFLVRHVMEAHGGSVELEGGPGRGSRFRMIFPLSSSGPEAGEQPTSPAEE